MVTDVSHYLDLSEYDSKFVQNMKLVFVFTLYGLPGINVFTVNLDDEVLAFGDNRKGCLGLGHSNSVKIWAKVEQLCDKQVINFAYGYRHVLALTETGHIYAWGCNTDGELGNGCTDDSLIPQVINIGEEIAEIACGAFHTVVLTKSGEVFCWGYNRYGQVGDGCKANRLSPYKITAFYMAKIVAICCGSYHSMALTDSGNVFVWGYNKYGQLGTGNFENKYYPVCVVVNGVSFNKISCGPCHSLCMSANGDVYSFGCNFYGQIGIGNKQHQNFPVAIFSNDKFVDIASIIQSNISVALSAKGNCFVWGYCGFEDRVNPTETGITSIHRVFADYSNANTTYKPIICLN